MGRRVLRYGRKLCHWRDKALRVVDLRGFSDEEAEIALDCVAEDKVFISVDWFRSCQRRSSRYFLRRRFALCRRRCRNCPRLVCSSKWRKESRRFHVIPGIGSSPKGLSSKPGLNSARGRDPKATNRGVQRSKKTYWRP